MKPRKAIPRVSKARRARSGQPGKMGIIRLYGPALEALRRDCYNRDKQACVDCGAHVYWEPGYIGSMHMAHIKSRGAGGSDVIDNVETKCAECHGKSHNCGGHPLPRKPA